MNPFHNVEIIGKHPDLEYVREYLFNAYDKHRDLELYQSWAQGYGEGADCFFAHIDLFCDLMHVLPDCHYCTANVIRYHTNAVRVTRWIHSFVTIEDVVVDVAHGDERLPIIQLLEPYLKERQAEDVQTFNREQFISAYGNDSLPGLSEGHLKSKRYFADYHSAIKNPDLLSRG